MNEENEWDHKLSAEVKEGPADCIRMDEVRAALKEMKRHKAPGLSGLSHLPTPSVFFSFAEEITLFAFCLLLSDTSHRGDWNPVDIRFM